MTVLQLDDAASLWVMGDIHGRPAAASRALARAGLVDHDGRWIAPSGTALLLAGDLIDRGPRSLEAIALEQRTRGRAAARGSVAQGLLGNHELMLLAAAAGDDPTMTGAWLVTGGAALLREAGIDAPWTVDTRTTARLGERLRASVPGAIAWAKGLPAAARWRDVVIVHAGLPRVDGWRALTVGRGAWEHWIRSLPNLRHPQLGAFRAAGVERVVVGHVPTPGEARVLVNGAVLSLDGNAGPTAPGRPSAVVLARIPPSGRFDLAEMQVVVEPVLPDDDGPDAGDPAA